jgi:histidinol-phosphate aminotransferase
MSVAAPAELSVGENVSRLIPYHPGKPIEEVKRELGLREVIKLASNENALGPSPLALNAIREAAGRAHLYPDASSYELVGKTGESLGIAPDHLIFGNGSDDVIHLLGITYLEAGDEVVQADPSFVRYESAAILNRAICHKVPLRDWTHDLDAMAERFNARTRLVFVANPNNPTGTIVTESQVGTLLSRLPERAIAVFDEAYFEYVQSPEYPRLIRYVLEGRNVVILRTFSKAYGLAGIRLGYGIARPEIVRHLNQVREPFNVSLIAQAAGKAALDDTDHLQRTIRMNEEGKRLLHDGFERLRLGYTPTEANFLWVDVGRPCRPVFDALLRRGVIVRTGDIFGAPNHLRVTIGTESENMRFLTDLESVLEEASQ